jgi:hypothetical protein
MLGRRSGTLGRIKATDYLAAEARRLGLEPAGRTAAPGRPMVLRNLDPAASLTAGGTVQGVGRSGLASGEEHPAR